MTTLVDKISVRWDAHYPALSGLACALVGYFYGPSFLELIHAKEWAIENIFVAVFTIGTVTAGFGLAIYTFLLTTETGFIGRVKNSIYYKHLLTYVIVATALSAILAVFSVPGMIIKDAPDPHSLHAIYVGLWSGICGWTIAAFIRAGHLFSVFAREHH